MMAKIKTYSINDLYFGLVDDKRRIGILDKEGIYHNFYYVSQKADEAFNEKFKVIASLKDILIKTGLDVLLLDKNGNPKEFLKSEEIRYLLNILERRLSMSQVILQRSNVISSNVVNIVSDLLGLNVSTPATPFKFQEKFDINEILISAKKLKQFKKYLFDYVQASLIAEKSVRLVFEVGARDYRIARSLNKAKIIQSSRLNQNIFSVDANLEGRIKVNDVDIKEYPKEKGFKKTIKNG